ncbi:MAG: Nif3-like dinuclear metal center hexameric protein [Ignavibacteriaceae bacterium]|nr:Nif3-like dinuclear metal center hexameric protein [Ignavibacteriaceae bacterium]
MTIKEIIKYLDDWAPKETAWQNDNVGIQVGRTNAKVKNLMLCLELTPEVITQAIEKNCNFIISHHPLIFYPIKKLDLDFDSNSKLIEKLLKRDITVFSAHTNLDFTKNGVSFILAQKLGLKRISFLKNLELNQFKISVFIPASHVEKVTNAIFSAGGGIIGEYSSCSFQSKGQGTFKGSDISNPSIGSRGNFEKVEEIKVEVLVDSWKLKSVINSMLAVHPYEEPAYDIYPLANKNLNYGAGAIGYFEKSLTVNETLNVISKKLKSNNLRFVGGSAKKIRKVAVCGGSGSDLIQEAINKGADAFITSDIKYHTFQSAHNKILLVDAGHYETEIPVIDEIQKRLLKLITKRENIKILKFIGSTNPINFYSKMRSHVN